MYIVLKDINKVKWHHQELFINSLWERRKLRWLPCFLFGQWTTEWCQGAKGRASVSVWRHIRLQIFSSSVNVEVFLEHSGRWHTWNIYPVVLHFIKYFHSTPEIKGLIYVSFLTPKHSYVPVPPNQSPFQEQNAPSYDSTFVLFPNATLSLFSVIKCMLIFWFVDIVV